MIKSININYFSFSDSQAFQKFQLNILRQNIKVSKITFFYFTLAFPLIFAISYVLYSLSGRIKKDVRLLNQEQDSYLATKILADQGNANAQYDLGIMYANGQERAVKYFELAAKQNHIEAQYNLGLMYENGRGVKQNHQEAFNYFELAANQGHAKAQCKLGIIYSNGRGVKKNDQEALKYFQLAASQDNVDAKCALGFVYANGEGVKQDDEKALKYFQLAASQGHAEAKRQVNKRMTHKPGVFKST